MDIANNIKAIRKARGITPTMMAKELGIEATNYPKFENRGNQLTYSNLEKISSALGVTVVELITWGDSREATQGDRLSNKELQDKIKELTVARDIAQGYANELKLKASRVYSIFHSTIRTIGDDAELGTVEVVEEGEDYSLYSTNYTDKELVTIFEIIYNDYRPLYSVLRELLQGGFIDNSLRMVELFSKHNQHKINNLH